MKYSGFLFVTYTSTNGKTQNKIKIKILNFKANKIHQVISRLTSGKQNIVLKKLNLNLKSQQNIYIT